LGINDPDAYLDLAHGEIREAFALRDDLLAMLFPHVSIAPSELLQTRVKIKLRALVDGIECQLLDCKTGQGSSWDVLAKSGLLRESGLIHFALARIAEDQLRQNMLASGNAAILSQLPVILLGHENIRLRDMAKQFLSAEQLAASGDHGLFQRLETDQLHLLCWRVVAVLQEMQQTENSKLIDAAQTLLSAHDDLHNPAAIARKLVFFLGPEYRASYYDPHSAGPHMFVAALAQDYGLESDLVFRLIAEGSAAPLLLMLKGQGVPVEHLPGILAVLRGTDNGDASPDLGNIYGMLDPVEARAAVAKWLDAENGHA
jgi:hypothetical protein